MINKKLGYYTVDDYEFASKIEACIYANQNKKQVKWHFNTEVFDKFDWSIEPDETLDQLYDKRSRDLREKYDYVVISYSGGADSHNIVQSFLRQNLRIDELIINTLQKSTDNLVILDPLNKRPENCSSEHYLQTIPRLKEIQKQNPQIKITVYDLSDHLFDYWINFKDAGWIKNKREGLNPLNVTRFNYLYFDDLKKIIEKEKSICLIFGVDKPRFFIYSDKKWYIKFVDRIANIVGIDSYVKNYDNVTVELFYWSPECTKMLSKQSYVTKKWLEMNPEYQKFWYYTNIDAKVNRLVHERILRSVLYSTWNNNWFQSDKSLNDWYSEFDTWFINGIKNTRNYFVWKEGLEYVQKNASDYLKINDFGIADGLVNISKSYYVSTFNDIKI
jgi:(2Fe-2S) ferredoxin